MTRLGYERFGAQGGDWGAGVTVGLAHHVPARVVGIHSNYAPWPVRQRSTAEAATEAEQRALADAAQHLEWGTGYALQQGTGRKPGLNAMPMTALVFPVSVAMVVPVATFHSRTMLSSERPTMPTSKVPAPRS